MKNLDPARAKWIRVRMGLLCGLMAAGLGGFVSSAYRVQVEDAASWKDAAESQRQRRLHIEPKRGGITDRNGTPLAQSVEVPSISADTVEMLKGIEGEAAQSSVIADLSARLGAALNMAPSEMQQKLATKRRFVWLKRRVTAEEAQAIRDLGDSKKLPPGIAASAPGKGIIKGLAVEGEGRRYYPGRELAGPVLGFVAPDGLGKEGLELALDEELRGRAEEVRGLRDRAGRLVFSEGTTDDSNLAGHDVQLALDQAIQRVAERELGSAFRTYETKGGSVIVMDPSTGEILALASAPGYNPNDYGDSEAEARRDRPVTDRFEPGSVMKVFTVAAALTAGTLKPTDTIYCEHGNYALGNVTIHDTHENDWLTVTQVLARSSNIGSLKIGLALGEPNLYGAYRRFGFGEPTGVPLPGEAGGVLRPRGRPWFEVEAANASFGQGISVTVMQLAVAMSAIANGGKVLEPILVKKITDARGRVIKEWTPHVRREAVPANIARTVAEMLTAVAETGGTGVEAAMQGYRVAGKTGTAQKVDPATGKYSEDRYTASFVGFVPAEKPRLVLAVVLDEPMVGRYGGDLAGPVFRRVAEASLRYLGVPPQNVTPKMKVGKGSDQESVAGAAKPSDDASPSSGEAMLTSATLAGPPSTPASGSERQVVVPSFIGPPLPSSVKIPDASGMGARDAVKTLGAAGLVPILEGSGRLVRQSPPAGSAVPKGSSVRLVFEPAS
jgi:cell division protein FtsI (penicillin-binding protein 3)